MTEYIIAQIAGVLGIVFSLLSFQMKERKKYMLCQIIAIVLFIIQLLLLGAITGGVLDIISLIRTVIFMFNNKKWASSPVWLFAFILAMIAVGVFTWQDLWSILPIIGSILSTVAQWMRKTKHIRAISLAVGPCWLIYNLVHGAYSGALNEVFAMTSIIIGIIRYDIKDKEVTKEEQK